MKRIVIAVLLSFLGPGLGQIYNRDFRKGAVLLLLTTALFFLPAIWLMARIGPDLPQPGQPGSQEALQAAVLQAVQSEKHTLNLITFLFLGTWAYAITQAYFKAKELSDQEAGPGGEDGPGSGDDPSEEDDD